MTTTKAAAGRGARFLKCPIENPVFDMGMEAGRRSGRARRTGVTVLQLLTVRLLRYPREAR